MSRGVPRHNARDRWADGDTTLGNLVRLLIGTLVSLACLYLATRGTDWQQVGAVLRGADPVWVAALVGISIYSYYVRSQRWRVLLRPIGDVPLMAAFSAIMVGFGATSVLPLRLGEIVRPALLGRRIGCGLSPALSSVVVERLFDMLFVIGMMVLLSFVHPIDPHLRQGAFALFIVAAGGMSTLVLMQWYPELAARLIDFVLTPLGNVGTKIRPLIDGLLRGMGALGYGRTVLVVLLYSVFQWVVITATWAAALLALRIPVPLLAGSITAVVIVATFVFLPQGPGFVGTWQMGCVTALGFFGVPQEQAIGYSVLTWIVQMVVNVAGGGFFLAREDVSLRDLIRQSDAEGAHAVHR